MAYDDIKKIVEQEVRDKVNDLVKAALDAQREKNMYGVADNPYYHLHTGIDSPTIPFTNLDGAPSTYGTVGQALIVNANRNGLTFGSAGATIYTGYVNSGATGGTPFPSGWSVSTAGAGDYTITHTLGSSSYAVVVQSVLSILVACVLTRGTNSFRVTLTAPSSGTFTNSDFMFILIPQ